MNIKQITIAFVAAAAGTAVQAAVPAISDVTMSQASDRLVTISYTLSDAPAVVTLDVQTNVTGDVWASIGGEAVWNAMGDVWKRVEAGNRTITWHPDHSWPDHKIDGNNARAVVTAWALENTPDYMVVDLETENTVRYYPGVDFLPKKGFNQAGAAVTNNPDYKTSHLLLRKIMVRGLEWTMGSTAAETGHSASFEATHKVTLTNNYYIGVFEVTQAQWKNIAGNSPSANFQVEGAMRPMESVCYNEIRLKANSNAAADSSEISSYSWPKDPNPNSFLGLLRTKTGLDFDLPSDAQWEFAARAGHGSGYWGDGSVIQNTTNDTNLNRLGRYQWNNPGGNAATASLAPADGGTAIVGSYAPNDWGIYDMHGNVWEWCLDWFEENISNNDGKVNINPSSPANTLSGAAGSMRVWRSAGYGSNYAKLCRAAYRNGGAPTTRSNGAGFRVICTAGLR